MKVRKITANDVKRIFDRAPAWDEIAEEINNLVDPIRLVGVMHITGVGASGEDIKVQDVALTNRMLDDGKGDQLAIAKSIGVKYGIETVTEVSMGSLVLR